MDTFDVTNAISTKLYMRSRSVNSKWWKLLDSIAYLLFVLWLVVLLFSILPHAGKLILSFIVVIGLIWLWVGQFFRFQVNSTVSGTSNLADRLDFESIEYFLSAQRMASVKQSGADWGVLWLALSYCQAGRYFMVRCGFRSVEEYSGLLAEYWKSSTQKGVWPDNFINLITQLANASPGKIQIEDILAAFIQSVDIWQKILATKQLDVKDGIAILKWYKQHKALSVKKAFWEKETAEGAIGRDWSYGYTPNLQLYARDISTIVAESRPIVVYGRENEVKQLEQVLAKSDANNALLVGEQGVGKSTIVRSLGQKIIKGNVAPPLMHKHIWELDTGRLIAGASGGGFIESRLKAVLDEAVSAGNIILFIDNIQSLLSREEKTGAINASAILLPYLKGAGLQIIGDTSIDNYHRDIEASPEIASSFEIINVSAPKKEEVVYVLEDTIPRFEFKYNVIFTFPAVKETVRVSDRYIHDKPFPAKAIELIDNVAVAASQKDVKIITPELIDAVVSVKTEVPVGETTKSEKEKLMNLEAIIHKRVIGQNEAVIAVASALKRARSGLRRENKPIGTFLFIGPTGVGKTETAKALAEAYFSSEKKIIRLDMSEYQGADAVNRLIGAAPMAGQMGEQGVLTKAIKDNPFSVVLLDEIEKSNQNVLNLFLQVLDEGRLTDGMGKTVDFTNAIVIATSNAGAEMIRQSIKQGEPYEQLKKRLLDFLQQNNIFRPEFLNRFDAVVAYRPLTMEELMQVVDIMIGKVAANLKDKRITLEVTPAAKQKLVQLGFDPVYGARPLWRTVQTKLEDPLAEKMLRDEIPPESVVTIDANDISG